jgi:hypothetical protein
MDEAGAVHRLDHRSHRARVLGGDTLAQATQAFFIERRFESRSRR